MQYRGRIISIACRFGGFIQPGLVDDRVDTDGRLAGRSVPDDQLTLAATNGNHRVNRHDARLHRLVDGLAANDAGRDFLDRISNVDSLIGPFAIDRFAQRIHDASQQPLADGHLQELAGGADFAALFESGVVAQDDHADFVLFKVQRQAGDAVAEVDHLVEHRVGQAFDLGDAIADLADDAHVLPGGRHSSRPRFALQFLVVDSPQTPRFKNSSSTPPVWPTRCRHRHRCPPGCAFHRLTTGSAENSVVKPRTVQARQDSLDGSLQIGRQGHCALDIRRVLCVVEFHQS